ncbi:ABC transporter permease subunit [Candidatus Sumerlaeota bacterium]|nr:ABC transporter permease subunit [Candidatus Sumerlaeota bacterium]
MNIYMRIWRLYRNELAKFVRQRFPWLAVFLVALAAFLIAHNIDSMMTAMDLTGYRVLILGATLGCSSFIPMLVIIFGSTLVASEVAAGTTRLALARPVTRFEFMTAKVMIGLTFAMMLMAAYFATIVLATPEQFAYEAVVDEGEVLASQSRLIGALAIAFLGTLFQLTAALAYGMMMSVLARGLINAIGAAIGIFIGVDVFKHVLQIPVPGAGEYDLAPMIFTSYMTDFLKTAQDIALGLDTVWFERQGAAWTSIENPGIAAILIPALSCIVFWGVAYGIFLRRDLHE